MFTFGGIKGEIEDIIVRERIRSESGFLALMNDAIENLWMSLVQFQVGLFLGGPTTLSIASGAERAAVVSVADPGVSDSPSLSQGGVSTLPAAYYEIKYTLVTESGTETLPSTGVIINRVLNQRITIASPAYQPDSSPNYPTGVIGYNVYAGRTSAATPSARMIKQNDEPILIGQSFTEDVVTGWLEPPAGFGPIPLVNTTGDNIFFIKSLELPLSSGGYKRWEQGDIDSALFKQFGRAVATTSEFQPYCYDFINQSSVEIRPAAGTSLSPRYFFINKPRRCRFLEANLPFANLSAQAFLKYKFASVYCIGINELVAAKAWALMAQDEKTLALQALTTMSHDKNLTIQPYMR